MIDQLITLTRPGGAALAVSGLLYASGITIAALAALFAPSAVLRRDARKVLALLLRRASTEDNPTAPTNSE